MVGVLKQIHNTKNALWMKVGDKTRTVDADFEELRKLFLTDSEQQTILVNNLQKQSDNLRGMQHTLLDSKLTYTPWFKIVTFSLGSIAYLKNVAENTKCALDTNVWAAFNETVLGIEAQINSHLVCPLTPSFAAQAIIPSCTGSNTHQPDQPHCFHKQNTKYKGNHTFFLFYTSQSFHCYLSASVKRTWCCFSWLRLDGQWSATDGVKTTWSYQDCCSKYFFFCFRFAFVHLFVPLISFLFVTQIIVFFKRQNKNWTRAKAFMKRNSRKH